MNNQILFILIILMNAALLPSFVCSQPEMDENVVIVQDEQDLMDLSLEELMNVQITSVSKKAQAVSDAPAAVYVVTQEDIRRSGVSSIPDALRMVPGIQVAQIDSNKWAVSARGFLGRFSNKILVLIDGRTVYTSLFSGTFWENQDLMLEDIERIEVIRGPGATLWGANAVNGIINIITKNAKDTQGGLFSVRTGTEETAMTGVRYGGSIGDDTFYRWYTKYKNLDDGVLANGNDADDEWDQVKTGFRMDSQLTDRDSLMLQSNLYHGDYGSNGIKFTPTPPYTLFTPVENETNGFDIATRWERDLENESSMALQMFYTWEDRSLDTFNEERHTLDVDFQHRFPLFERHELIWGAGYRFTSDSINSPEKILFLDSERDFHLFSMFVQDEISLIEEELTFYLGSKIEHNDFTGLEIQPNARLLWSPNENHSVWAAVSRAVRTPARSDERASNDLVILSPNSSYNPFPIPALGRGIAGMETNSEDAISYELGYRTALFDKVTLDTAVFYTVYDNIVSANFGEIFIENYLQTPFIIVPFISNYDGEAESYGAELALDVKLTEWWSVKPAYNYYQVQFSNIIEYAGIAVAKDEQVHQVSLRSQMNLPHNVELDLWLRYMDKQALHNIPGYLVLDGRIGWKPKENLEINLGFQNAFDNQHPEYGNPIFDAIRNSEIEHRVYASLTLTF